MFFSKFSNRIFFGLLMVLCVCAGCDRKTSVQIYEFGDREELRFYKVLEAFESPHPVYYVDYFRQGDFQRTSFLAVRFDEKILGDSNAPEFEVDLSQDGGELVCFSPKNTEKYFFRFDRNTVRASCVGDPLEVKRFFSKRRQ